MKALIAWLAVSSGIAFAMATAASAQSPASAQNPMHYSETVNGNCGSNTPPCTITFPAVKAPTGAVLDVQKVSCFMTTGGPFAGYVYLSKTNNASAQEFFAAPPLSTTIAGFTTITLAESTVFFVEPNASPTVTLNTFEITFLNGPICTVSGTMHRRDGADSARD